MPKLTIRDLFDLKGKRQLAVVFVDSVEEARACEMAGIDQLVTYQEICRDIRRVAPETFLTCGIFGDHAASDADAIRAGLAAMDDGADAVYTGMSLKRVEAMAQEMIPVVGHVGLVPYRSTWFGGMRAVGRTAAEAHQVYRDTLAYQNAGAIAVEMEVVPHAVAAEIARRVTIQVISMGSGAECDAQYLFASDILGVTDGHVPRHAKTYADLRVEEERLQALRADALGRYKQEVSDGSFPDSSRTVEIDPEEYRAFLSGISEPEV